ncbi:maestro heat-like repeat-containing protein family member 6 [Oenanthe melanoleuca]|uniref:maestro heat-like repeat-containing protein family member 6 n=1 Tax=Oenanthe melanoleuca TaxID=2939378 RepID=UPI0024C0ECBF|nr:maestro heat-like repeat-containing protein family member 6 [Oenanthe melanoleuca]
MVGKLLHLLEVFRAKEKEDPGVSPQQQPEELHPFQPMQDGAAMDRTQEQDPTRGRFRRTAQMFQKFVPVWRRKTSTTTEGTAEPDSSLTELQAEPHVSPDLPERSEESDSARSDDRAQADMAVTEDVGMKIADTGDTQGITNTDTTPNLRQELIADYFKDPCASSQQHLSSLWPGLEASQDCVPTQAMVTGPPQALRPAQRSRKGSSSRGKLGKRSKSSPCLPQVPAMVKSIHQRVTSQGTLDARLRTDILRLAGEHPADVVLTLLRCAPTCDRAAAMIWRAIGSSGPAVEKVLPSLLCVMEDWPLHSMFTSDGDNKNVFALAATLVLWVMVQVPESQEAMILYSSRLFVALLFHVVITTQQMPPEEVDNFWRVCQEQHHFSSKPNRFALQTLRSLLCRLQCDNVVMAMECKRGWDTLLCADTQHYAVGLLAREMRHFSLSFCSGIARRLLGQLNREEPRWDLPFLAFLVEVLECLDLSECGDSILEIMSRFLRSNSRERRRLALRGLVLLSKDPSLARKMCSLSQSLQELLGNADREVVGMTLRVFTSVLQNKDILISSTTAPKLAEALLELFDNDNSHVQVLSFELFCKVMELVVDEGKKALKSVVCQSLLPLFIHCHNEKRCVAEAAREALHCTAKLLRRRNLENLVKTAQLWKFAECLLAEDRSRAAEHLRQALRYLRSPQEPLREAAVRFIGMAGALMRGKKDELQVLREALQALRRDDSPSKTNIVVQQLFSERAAAEPSSSAGSEEPASHLDLQMPWKMRLP